MHPYKTLTKETFPILINMGEKGKVTIYDLAQRLHTTASTVSRALQNNPRISLKTREAVQKLAKELNYIPDPVAHHLRTGKGNVLGIIVPRIDRNFFATIISSFQDQAQKHGFQVIIAASGESEEQESNAIKAMIAKKVDGVAVSLSTETQNPVYPEMLSQHNIPLVYFDRLPDKVSDCDSVCNDNFQIGYDAVVQLHKLGCRKICHFAGPFVQPSYSDRYNGYRKALEDLGLPFRDEWLFQSSITIEAGTEAAQRILQMEDRPDGIFSAGDFPAITAIDIFRRKGIKVPDEIAIIGVANEPFDNYLSTPLASFDLHQQRIGEMAAKLLLSHLGEIPEMNHPSHLIVNHNLILRDSAI